MVGPTLTFTSEKLYFLIIVYKYMMLIDWLIDWLIENAVMDSLQSENWTAIDRF